MPEQVGTRFLAVRHAAQDATDFGMTDEDVRRFIALRDEGAGAEAIAAELDVEPEVVDALVQADEAQALAHRIATGEEEMYPAPKPSEQVVDTRIGSAAVPAIVLIAVLLALIAYAALR
jgi:hypothetical protein